MNKKVCWDKKGECPVGIIVAAILVVIAVGVTVALIVRKVRLISEHRNMDEGFWVDEVDEDEDDHEDEDLEYANERDFDE
ncbi:MAG: hypothetical protein FWG68_10275 [Defluviitaleaceae bacterium]|nr:hypothetical protein [Defluviitaleaceae bacterium]